MGHSITRGIDSEGWDTFDVKMINGVELATGTSFARSYAEQVILEGVGSRNLLETCISVVKRFETDSYWKEKEDEFINRYGDIPFYKDVIWETVRTDTINLFNSFINMDPEQRINYIKELQVRMRGKNPVDEIYFLMLRYAKFEFPNCPPNQTLASRSTPLTGFEHLTTTYPEYFYGLGIDEIRDISIKLSRKMLELGGLTYDEIEVVYKELEDSFTGKYILDLTE